MQQIQDLLMYGFIVIAILAGLYLRQCRIDKDPPKSLYVFVVMLITIIGSIALLHVFQTLETHMISGLDVFGK